MNQIGRNEKCICGSNDKYKRCCQSQDQKRERISVFTEFMSIPDPRDNRGKRYELIDLFVMVIYGILNGYDDFDNLADFLEVNKLYFKNLLLINKTPSHDCLSDLFATINPKVFMDVFVKWVSKVVEQKTGAIIAIDGKAVRSARDKINGGNTPYILSAYLSEIGISLGQVEVGKKSNEIKSIPELLQLLDIKGCYITIDAMGTQESITRKIISLGGHFVLKVKDNQEILKHDLESYFAENIEAYDLDKCTDIKIKTTDFEKNHGREEYREYYLTHDITCITNKNKWDTVSSIGMVRVYRCINDKLEIKDHFYIMDTPIDMDTFVKATRNHWNIECGLHWRLDVILNEDRSRNRIGHSIANLSAIRKIVFNLVRLDASLGKLSFEKKLTRYKAEFGNIENLIFNVIPAISA
jgi:predicted transposase YbfD/YdcC